MRRSRMRKRSMAKLFLVTAGLSMLVAVTPALANHNAPLKAKKLKVDLATAYNTCAAPNDTTGGAPPLPACHPPTLTSSTSGTHVVTFGPKGAANVQAGVATGDINIGVKSADVQDNGVLIADGQQLGLHIDHAVSTSDNCTSGDVNGCTTVDLGPLFNNTFKTTCTAGKCTLKTTVNTLTPGQIVAGDRVNITISGLGMNDQDGNLCFAEGLFIP
jgi:hypothetical protein